MNRTVKIGLISVLTLGLAGGVFAVNKHRGFDSGKKMEYMLDHIAGELKLNDTQEASLDALAEKVMNFKHQMHPEADGDTPEFRNMITAEQFDQAKMLDIINAKTLTVQQNAGELVAALGNFLDQLDADQKKRIAKHMNHKRRGRGHHRFGGKHGDDHNKYFDNHYEDDDEQKDEKRADDA